MPAKITIIEGHPDPSPARLNHALAESYATAATASGAEVRRIALGQLEIPFMRSAEEFYHGSAPDALAQAQRDVLWADHIVLIYPLWLSDMPALCKAFLEQTFRPNALSKAETVAPFSFLRGKSFRFVVTCGMPAFVYRSFYGAHSLRSLERILSTFGAGPITDVVIGNVEGANDETRARWIERMASFGVADTKPHAPFVDLRSRLLYAAMDWWMRLSTPSKGGQNTSDILLDHVMPVYDVHESNSIAINAPADVTFETIQQSNLAESPLVRALFQIRDRIMGGTGAQLPLPAHFAAQMKALGWTVISQDASHEIVLGTVAEPWKATPGFRPIAAEQFSSFDDPGFAKIAFSITCQPVDPRACTVRIETRVQTTDQRSRARFRRYWMLAFPGIEIIRLALLHQVKREAEARKPDAIMA